MEHRWGNRIAVDQPVRLSCAGSTGAGILRNLSISGAFIETLMPLTGMVTVRMRVQPGLNGGRTTRQAAGFVVRRELAGFAIEWCELGAMQLACALPPSARSSSRSLPGHA